MPTNDRFDGTERPMHCMCTVQDSSTFAPVPATDNVRNLTMTLVADFNVLNANKTLMAELKATVETEMLRALPNAYKVQPGAPGAWAGRAFQGRVVCLAQDTAEEGPLRGLPCCVRR